MDFGSSSSGGSGGGGGGPKKNPFEAMMKAPQVFPVKSRPKLESFGTMQGLMHDEDAFDTRFPPSETNDANTDRLMAAIYQARDAFHASGPTEYAKRAGHVNEARHFDSVLRKYQSMSPEEQAKRQYYPQTTIFPSDNPQNFRRPDLLKIKDNGDGSGPRASFTEFKSQTFDATQRQATLGILSNPGGMSGTQHPGLGFDESARTNFDFSTMPVTRYKTVFTNLAGPHPVDPGKDQLTPMVGGKGVITGTGVSVFSKNAK